MDVSSIAEFDPSFFETSCIVSSVTHLLFQCTLPPLFSNSPMNSNLAKSDNKGHKKDDDENDKDEHYRLFVNDLGRSEWKLLDDAKLSDAFSSQEFKETPKFKNVVQLCAR